MSCLFLEQELWPTCSPVVFRASVNSWMQNPTLCSRGSPASRFPLASSAASLPISRDRNEQNVSVSLLGYVFLPHTPSRASREFLLSKADLPETIWQSLTGEEKPVTWSQKHTSLCEWILNLCEEGARALVILQFILSQEWKWEPPQTQFALISTFNPWPSVNTHSGLSQNFTVCLYIV